MLLNLLFSTALLFYLVSALSPDDFILSEDEWRTPQAPFSGRIADTRDTHSPATLGVVAGLLKRQSWAVCEAFVVGKKCTVDRLPPYNVNCNDAITPFNFKGVLHADHILEAQIVAKAIDQYEYKLSDYTTDQLKAVVRILNSRGNMHFVSAEINEAKGNGVKELLKQILEDPSGQCTDTKIPWQIRPRVKAYLAAVSVQYFTTLRDLDFILKKPKNKKEKVPDLRTLGEDIYECIKDLPS